MTFSLVNLEKLIERVEQIDCTNSDQAGDLFVDLEEFLFEMIALMSNKDVDFSDFEGSGTLELQVALYRCLAISASDGIEDLHKQLCLVVLKDVYRHYNNR